EENKLACERGIDGSQRRKHDDVAVGLQPGEAERMARLDLAPRHRLDAGAKDFGGITREVQAHAQKRRLIGLEAQSDRRQRKIEDEKLDQERRVADAL